MKNPNAGKTIQQLAPLIASGRLRSERLTEECLEAIRRDNARLNAFITVCAEEALAQARLLDRESETGRSRGPLHGIPISLKDLIDLKGHPTTAASRVRQRHVASADAPVVTRLREAGAVIIGKTNLHEFAFGTTSEDSAYGPVRNPLDPARSAGGSSGGSAAGIVSGMSVASVGTDTGGSIRIPAAACGLVGLKPEYGGVPADGVVPLSRSLDHVGPLAGSAGDAWHLYEAMAGLAAARGFSRIEGPPPTRLSLAAVRPYYFDVLDQEVRETIETALEKLAHAGMAIKEAAIPHASDVATIYLHIQLPEASAYHASTLAEHPELYTPNVRLRLEMGRYVLAEDYVRAERGRAVLRAEVDRALEGVDALVMPTLPVPAPRIGQESVAVDGTEWPVRAMMLRLTQTFNLTGHPAITLPCGRTRQGLPCGLQLVGRRGGIETLLGAAVTCEQILAGSEAGC